MKKLRRAALEIEKDQIEEDGKVSSVYDSILTDVMILEWQDLHNPWKWVISDKDLLHFFEESFKHNSKTIKDIELIRGTDYINLYNLKSGDIIDYSERYTSWTTDKEVSCNFTDPDSPIFIIYKGDITSFELKTNRSEKEFIVGPCKLLIIETLNIVSSDERKIQADIIERALHGESFIGTCKIHIVKMM